LQFPPMREMKFAAYARLLNCHLLGTIHPCVTRLKTNRSPNTELSACITDMRVL